MKTIRYRDYDICYKWWRKQFSMKHNGKELLFDDFDELKDFIDSLYTNR